MVQWFVQLISSRNIAGSIPAEYGFTRLSSPSLSLGGYQQPKCVRLSICAWWTHTHTHTLDLRLAHRIIAVIGKFLCASIGLVLELHNRTDCQSDQIDHHY